MSSLATGDLNDARWPSRAATSLLLFPTSCSPTFGGSGQYIQGCKLARQLRLLPDLLSLPQLDNDNAGYTSRFCFWNASCPGSCVLREAVLVSPSDCCFVWFLIIFSWQVQTKRFGKRPDFLRGFFQPPSLTQRICNQLLAPLPLFGFLSTVGVFGFLATPLNQNLRFQVRG